MSTHPTCNPVQSALDWRPPADVSIKSIRWLEPPWDKAEHVEVELQSGSARSTVQVTASMTVTEIFDRLTAAARRLRDRFQTPANVYFDDALDLEHGRSQDTVPVRLRA